MPSDPKANTCARTALLLLSAFVIVVSVGVYLVADLGQLQDRIAAREGQAALQGIHRRKPNRRGAQAASAKINSLRMSGHGNQGSG